MDGFDKKTLRDITKRKVREMDAVVRARASERIMERVEELEAFRRARTIALYRSLPDEVDTREFIERWSGRKRIVLPVVVGDDLIFKEYTPGALAAGAFGIEEPSVGEPVPAHEIDLVIIPGVAFSTCGERLGRGRGYYDRFLTLCPAFRVGVCFAAALVEKIACEAHDAAMDAVVTENRVITFK